MDEFDFSKGIRGKYVEKTMELKELKVSRRALQKILEDFSGESITPRIRVMSLPGTTNERVYEMYPILDSDHSFENDLELTIESLKVSVEKNDYKNLRHLILDFENVNEVFCFVDQQ